MKFMKLILKLIQNKSAMKNVMVYESKQIKEVEKQEFNIIINVFLSGKEYNII